MVFRLPVTVEATIRAAGACAVQPSRGPDRDTVPTDLHLAASVLLNHAAASAGQAPPPAITTLLDELDRTPLRPGDLVLVAMMDPLIVLSWFFALIAHGQVPALVAGGTSRARLALIAEGTGARAVLRSPAAVLGRGAPECDRVHLAQATLILFDGRWPPTVRNPGEAVILTSGTSGVATGCVHNVAAMLRNGRKHMDATNQGPSDVVLVSLPVHYSFALVAQVFGCLAVGADATFDGPPFTVPRYCSTVTDRGVTTSSLTPRLIASLIAEGGQLPAALRRLTIGGQPVEVPDLRTLLRRAPDKEIYVTYGLTQAGPRVSTLAAHAEPPGKLGSVGIPLPGVQVSVDSSAGMDRPEVCVSSDTLCVGTLGGRPHPGGRVLRTGDYGWIDDDGYLVIRGRLRDVVEVAGEKVMLSDLSAIARRLPGVRAATFSVSGEGGPLDLLVETEPDALIAPDEFRRQLAALLRPVERPDKITIAAGELGQWQK